MENNNPLEFVEKKKTEAVALLLTAFKAQKIVVQASVDARVLDPEEAKTYHDEIVDKTLDFIRDKAERFDSPENEKDEN